MKLTRLDLIIDLAIKVSQHSLAAFFGITIMKKYTDKTSITHVIYMICALIFCTCANKTSCFHQEANRVKKIAQLVHFIQTKITYSGLMPIVCVKIPDTFVEHDNLQWQYNLSNTNEVQVIP